MKGKKRMVRLVVLMLCVAALSACMQASAREITYSCDYVRITNDGFVADTFNGVEARYNLYGRTLYCNEIIVRYYKEVYGLTVQTGGKGPRVVGNSEYYFRVTSAPQPGDVMYAPAAARGKGYSHWGICKEADSTNGTITMFEQNWRWNGKAGVNRQIPYSGSCYTAYELVDANGVRVVPGNA